MRTRFRGKSSELRVLKRSSAAFLLDGDESDPFRVENLTYDKAFDSVEHSSAMQALHTQGVDNKYITILNKLYNQSCAKVKTEIEGRPFGLKRGVRQGDPISPKLFTSVLEDIFRKLNWNRNCGININGSRLNNLRFADDVVLFAKSPRELQSMLQDLCNASRSAGLLMNMTKTQVMSNGLESPIIIDGAELQYVSEYVYLGQLVSFHQKTENEIKRRISLAWKAFWSLKFIILEGTLSKKLRVEILETCVTPVLLYGCQTWSLTAKLRNSLQICQRKMLRKILGLSLRDRVPNEVLQKMAAIKDPALQATNTKWKWGGHVARLRDGRWTQKVTLWDPRIGKRSPGRPRRRWADLFSERVGSHWSSRARHREDWRNIRRQVNSD
ncbi:hypothetical protein ANN_08289 [Periplaneta americana]|uniref:Reverse transcriptase domain-containing protein n=1 Tax=Periplaneta americana TaxID=6978 RepID=A0ABQ8T257_PERAM|nr:hypothetical protein ANN_08289 [Periplaneta americana]